MCMFIYVCTRSLLEDSRLFGPSPWKVLAATYDKQKILSNPAFGENILRGNLVMETGCICIERDMCMFIYAYNRAADMPGPML